MFNPFVPVFGLAQRSVNTSRKECGHGQHNHRALYDGSIRTRGQHGGHDDASVVGVKRTVSTAVERCSESPSMVR